MRFAHQQIGFVTHVLKPNSQEAVDPEAALQSSGASPKVWRTVAALLSAKQSWVGWLGGLRPARLLQLALQGYGKLPQLVVTSDAPTVSRHLGTADLSWGAESCHGWWA